MSAFLVSDYHISYLVEAGVRFKVWVNFGSGYDYLTSEKAQHIYEVLKRENIRSINHRYKTNGTKIRGLRKYVTNIDPILVLKAISCYEYQSCEHQEWETSLAFSICRAIEKAAIRELPGYENAPWGLENQKAVR